MSEVKIPEGYKQTEVGVIPEDWKLAPLGEIVKENHQVYIKIKTVMEVELQLLS